MSLEHACRVARGENSAKCQICRKPPLIRVTQEHREYWLRLGGVTAPLAGRGQLTRYVKTHGLPESLSAIVASAAFLP